MPLFDASVTATLQYRWLRTLCLGLLSAAGLLSMAGVTTPTHAQLVQQPPQEGPSPTDALAQGHAQPTATDIQTRFAQAVLAAEQNRTQEAIDLFSALVRDYPYQPEITNNLAVLYAAKGDDIKAAQVLQQVVQASPNYATGHENLGDIYARMAQNSYAQAMRLDGTRQNVQSKLALAQKIGQVTPHVPRPANAKPVSIQPSTAAIERQNKLPADAGHADVEQAVQAWAQAWASQNIQAYYAAYSPNFEPPAGTTQAEWKAVRRQLIVNKPSIALATRNLQVQHQGDRATAHFLQDYTAGTIQSKTRKTLQFERVGGQWLIVREGNHSQ